MPGAGKQQSTRERERAGRRAPAWVVGGWGPGGRWPTGSCRGLVPDDAGVAAVAAGVDIADGDGAPVGLRDRGAPVAGRRVATVARGTAGSPGRRVAVAAIGTG